ncbi:CaiB/BaiF CoA transferase family protein [Hoeflea prorocentri]|uniref:CaiB/BaiF CoA-transferase family protein n=1 Tax=Hoeflea prorocentri TaxID=1922333 RepID=A0A9X3ZG90_9HYPH|nr:CaiB/BaiF CoA-transferase family protein [Hoeflea prorocentri]MCY6379500.1 CaiB/BaiF CoA-transferase family protein [Hoeflea prorocentri]MDA5397300.1 CaiB/BaiF CoA-transferase family protein [Hoeflea prorocentri]
MTKPLIGLKIVEMAGLGPAPFACYLLAGLGAHVTRIEGKGRAPLFLPLDPQTNCDLLYRRIVQLDLKSADEHAEAVSLIREADVLIEGFRPGVMERLGLGPDSMMEANPRLIYARMTGFGQDGPMSAMAGHDLNYIALSGVLSMIGRKGEAPVPPLNLVGDYGGGTMVLIMGVLAALFARGQTGQGQVLDTAMVEGSAMLASPIFSFMASGVWDGDKRGENLLDTGCPFYDTYRTSDARYVAIAPLEPQFFAELVDRLGLDAAWKERQYDRKGWPELRALIAEVFLTRPRDEWAAHFDGTDACVSPVLTPQEAANHPHNISRQSFDTVSGHIMPGIAPKFSSN